MCRNYIYSSAKITHTYSYSITLEMCTSNVQPMYLQCRDPILLVVPQQGLIYQGFVSLSLDCKYYNQNCQFRCKKMANGSPSPEKRLPHLLVAPDEFWRTRET